MSRRGGQRACTWLEARRAGWQPAARVL